ncbi:MAG: dual specificity protein phosphatase family protein [Nitrospirae bacterium]|nr:dual specificity protein phosphatase family protein [Nitrospirota bacterium]
MIIQVVEGIYRGPRPRCLNDLIDLNIKTILNLEDDMAWVESEQSVSSMYHVNVISLPMSEIKRPSRVDLYKAVHILQDESLHPIYVHCLHGQDRTGYVIAAYRMLVQGWIYEFAYQEAKDNGHKWWFAPYLLFWPKSLKELAK